MGKKYHRIFGTFSVYQGKMLMYQREIQEIQEIQIYFPNRPYINTPKQMNMDTNKYITINKHKTGISVP